MQTEVVYTYSSSPGETLFLWVWTNDFGTYDAFQAAPSLNQGFNEGEVTISEVRAHMPVTAPAQSPSLAYILTIQNTGGGYTMVDVYNAWQ